MRKGHPGAFFCGFPLRQPPKSNTLVSDCMRARALAIQVLPTAATRTPTRRNTRALFAAAAHTPLIERPQQRVPGGNQIAEIKPISVWRV
jgi:hypothetical protein